MVATGHGVSVDGWMLVGVVVLELCGAVIGGLVALIQIVCSPGTPESGVSGPRTPIATSKLRGRE
jgi:hypothetical protein